MPRLIVKATPSHGDSVVDVTRVRTTVGRSARNDLCVEDPFTSRLHAEVRRQGDGFWLSDLGSANGTYLNGSRLAAPAQLHDGDRVRIGETEIDYSERADTAPTGGRTSILVSDSGYRSQPVATITRESQNSASQLLSSIDSAQRTQLRTPTPGSLAPVVQDDTLAIISKVSLALLSPVSIREAIDHVLDCVFSAVPADRAYALLLEKVEDSPEPVLVCISMKTRSVAPVSISQVEISKSISDEVLKQGTSVLTSDAQQDPRFQEHKSIALGGIRSVMAVPFALEGRVLGMLYVDSPFYTNRFTERDLKLLTLIAGVAAIRIENVHLVESQIEQKRLADELALASEIQLRLHPAGPPAIESYDVVGVSFPCFEVGGDYYDFILKRDGKSVIALGDVSGKGIAAALLMSSVHAAVRAHSTTRLSPAEIVREINQYTFDNTPANRYVTLFYSELDARTHELTYINAGHNSPILVRSSGEVTRLDIGGFPVGITSDGDYREGWVHIGPGDVLLIYSDGATESVDEKGEEFGEAPLIEIVQKNRTRTAAGIRDRVEEALTRFVGKAKAVDDLTLVIVKRKSET